MFMRKYTAILWASWREALYLPFSRDMMVCLVTPRASASSSCVIRDCFLNSCILVFTYTTLPFLLFPQAASQNHVYMTLATAARVCNLPSEFDFQPGFPRLNDIPSVEKNRAVRLFPIDISMIFRILVCQTESAFPLVNHAMPF